MSEDGLPRGEFTDLAADVGELADLAGVPESEDAWIATALDTLRHAIPYEIATLWDRAGNELQARCVRGRRRSRRLAEARIDLDRRDDIRELLDSKAGRLVGRSSGDPDPYRGLLEPRRGRALLVVPVRVPDRTIGLLSLIAPRGGVFEATTVHLAAVYAQLIALGMLAARRAERMRAYRDTLEERNRLLVEGTDSDADACRAVESAVSRPMRRIVQMAKQVAATDSPVLVTGETGVGKEVLARAIHAWSARSAGPWVAVNCAALPRELIESELFGHRRGAFSGAERDRPGRFRLADGGTLLLDEIGDLPADLQVKLLRALETRSVEPLGGDGPVPVDVRIIAATHVDLERAVDEGRFREDLFYRLHVFPIHVPPLRDRAADLPVLVETSLERARRRTGRGPWTVPRKDLERMRRYDWPGNVRELVNVLERARVTAPLGGRLRIALPDGDPRRGRARADADGGVRSRRRGTWPTLAEHQRRYIEEALEATGGKIYGEDGAAALLGLPPSTLQGRMRRLGVKRPAPGRRG